MKKNYDYGYGRGYKPISSWGYVGYSVLYAIPVLGWIIWLYNALFASNKNVKNHARSLFCGFIVALVVLLIAAVALYFAYTSGMLQPVIDILVEMGLLAPAA